MTVPSSALQSPERRGSWLRTIKAVAWGFFGVRKDSAYQEDIARLSPLQIIGVGFVAAVLLVVGLVVLVKYVALAP